MKLPHLLTLLFACVVFTATAQDPFRPGYIKLKTGEQQPGLVGKVIPGFPEKIEYKANESDVVSTYRSDEIDGYGITNGIYYTSFVTPGTRNEWIFVEKLAEGDLTLIQRNTFFFAYRRGEVNVVHLDENYKWKLKKLMKNCPHVAVQSGTVELNSESLTKHVKAYNECTPQGKPNLAGMPRTVSVGFIAGYDNSNASFSDDKNFSTRFLSASKLRDRSFGQFGIDITFKNYKVSNYVGFYIGVLYNRNQYEESNKVEYRVGSFPTTKRTEYNQYAIDITEIKFPVGLEFAGPTRKRFSTHGRLGIIYTKILSMKSTRPLYAFEDDNSGSIYNQTPTPLTSFKHRVLASVALGVDYRVFDKSRVRLQFSYGVGSVKATVGDNMIPGQISGLFTSLNIMGGFIF